MDLETQVRWMYRLKRDNQLFTPNSCITFENNKYTIWIRYSTNIVLSHRTIDINMAFNDFIEHLKENKNFDEPYQEPWIDYNENEADYRELYLMDFGHEYESPEQKFYSYEKHQSDHVEEILIALFNHDNSIIDAIQDTIVKG